MIGPNETLITKGVRSTVYSYNELGEPAGPYGRYGIGHVLLADLDEKYDSVPDIRMYLDAMQLDGPSVIVESSDGSFHVINLCVRSFTEIPSLMRVLESDKKHIRIGEDRGWWRLRVGPKLTENDNRYKPMPKVKKVHNRPSDRPVSGPHTELLRKLHGLDGGWMADHTFRGNCLEVNSYTTFSDYGKKLQQKVME